MQVFHVGHPIPNEDLGMAGTIRQSAYRLAFCSPPCVLKDAVSVLQTLAEQDADPAADDTSDAPEGMAPQKVWRRGWWDPVCIETESLSLKRSEVVVEGPEDECTPKMKRLKLLPRE